MSVARHPQRPPEPHSDEQRMDSSVSFSYSTIETALSDLRTAVEAAIKSDEDEATSFWSEVKALFRDTTSYSEKKTRFDEEAGQAKEQARNLVDKAFALCTEHYKPIGDVPAKLNADRSRWGQIEADVTSLRKKASELVTVPGWSGAASDAYAATVTVQVNALSELRGIAASLRQSCNTGALLNTAMLTLVRTSITAAVHGVQQPVVTGGDSYYLRTCQAVWYLGQLVPGIEPKTIREAAQSQVTSLQAQLKTTRTMPVVIEPGRWPSDGSRAGVSPADTGRGVTESGLGVRDTATSAGACIAGLNR